MSLRLYCRRTLRCSFHPRRSCYTTLAACPPPTRAYRPTPTLPDEIDYTSPLDGTMAPYHEQVVLATGRSDWTSRVEDDEGPGMELVKGMKEGLGRRGKWFDPTRNIMVTASSFGRQEEGMEEAWLFPSFVKVKRRKHGPHDVVEAVGGLIEGFVRKEEEAKSALDWTAVWDAEPLRDVVVLICGHGCRDQRCGILGPVLQKEFEDKLGSAAKDNGNSSTSTGFSVGLISHIGGHKYAGNVIIYIPPNIEHHPLAGKGIWYGRVEPKHVEGIVESTIESGEIIQELFRGGINSDRRILRSPR